MKSALLLYPSGTHRFPYTILSFDSGRKVPDLRGQTVSVDDVDAGVVA